VLAPVAAPVFTSDAAVRSAVTLTLYIMAAGIPLAGYVFVLDGVLIGAGDARYLAITGAINLAVYLPLLVWLETTRPDAALAWLWVAFGFGYMGARALTLGLRAKGSRWIVTGAR
jgi:Na+-driven multidrug efflux pump